MSYLGQTLADLLLAEGKTQRQVALAAQVPPSAVSDVIRERRCSPAMLQALCLAISDDPQRRLAVFKAHCADEAQRAGLADILPLADVQSQNLLPQLLRDDFELLVQAILAGNTNLQGLIHELAEVYRIKKHLEELGANAGS